MKYDTQTPYIAAYVILRKDNKVAFVLRENTSWMNGYYSLPAGKVENDESFIEAAIREGKEEVGVDVIADDLRFVQTVHRYSPDTDMVWVDVYFEATKWSGEPTNTEPDMHSELAWLDINNFPENVIPSTKAAMDSMLSGQLYSEFGWDESNEALSSPEK